MRRLIVIANRLPVRRIGAGTGATWQRSSGGLVTAMQPVLRRRTSVWVGWSGSAGRAPTPFVHERLSVKPIALTEREVELYYHGFCNRTLWPLFHDAIRTPEFDRATWDAYIEINQRYARGAARIARRRDLVWVHDYQLMLVPRMLRELRPDLRIGFFLHIPFPPEELFAWLPWRQVLTRGVLGADLVGFQTQADAQNFSRVARRFAPAEGTDAEVHIQGRKVQVGTFPISVDFKEFERMAMVGAVQRRASAIRGHLGKRKVLLSVDRLDYTKGIESRLNAFEELLRRGQLSVQDAVLVQIAVPSREDVSDYRDMRTRIEQIVGRINGEYSHPGMVAVHYFRRSVTPEELVAYYRAADVMVVTPLRDGMNLVAKEYVAARFDNTGALILSEFAGASRELRRALLVNPRDLTGFATTLQSAMNIDREDARRRMLIMRMIVRRHDVHDWAENFLEALA